MKVQIAFLLLPDLTPRRSVEYVADLELGEFCELDKDAKTGALSEDDGDDGDRDEGTEYIHAILSLVTLTLERVWITFCPRGRGRMGRDTRTRICTVLVVAHADVAKPNGIRRVLLAVGRYFITPTHQRRLRVSSSMRRKTTSTSYLQPYASLVALARLVMHLAHPLLHTPVYRPNKPT